MLGRILRIVIGIALLAVGWMIAFLMTIYILPRDIFLSIVSYMSSIAGLLITVYELTSHALGRVKKRS